MHGCLSSVLFDRAIAGGVPAAQPTNCANLQRVAVRLLGDWQQGIATRCCAGNTRHNRDCASSVVSQFREWLAKAEAAFGDAWLRFRLADGQLRCRTFSGRAPAWRSIGARDSPCSRMSIQAVS